MYFQAQSAYAKDKNLPLEDCSPVLAGINVPDPVFFCTIEAPSSGQQKALDEALTKMTREDPSLRVTYDVSSGQTILKGMGELHLEVCIPNKMSYLCILSLFLFCRLYVIVSRANIILILHSES